MKQSLWVKLWSFFSILSLDVVMGALGGLYFFQKLLDVPVPSAIYFLLGCAVWVVYTIDHLVDGSIETSGLFSERHAFHYKFRSFLFIAVGLVIGCSLCVLWLIPSTHMVIPYGLGLACMIACWYTVLYFFKTNVAFLKEVFIALFYTIGIAMSPFLLVDSFIPFMVWWMCVLYFLTALINLTVLSYFDRNYDEQHDFGSVSSVLDETQHRRFCYILLIGTIGLLLIALGLATSYYKIYCGVLLLIVVIHYQQFTNVHDIAQKRRWMEIAFSLPWLLFLF